MKKPKFRTPTLRPIAALAVSMWVAATTAEAALKDGIVAYWPMDSVVGTKTPDLVSGYDMELANL
ncbi:MAG: hypothetical protein JNK85_23215, partial [Verrucomicrobiales bacterium]|nr:hypothetical protein [Verrucomicrobiales bacterium]